MDSIVRGKPYCEATSRVLQGCRADHCSRMSVLAPEATQAIGDVGELRVDLSDHSEEPARLDDVA